MMDKWKRDALISREGDLQLYLSLIGIMSLLEKSAGGFMTAAERMSVEEERGRVARVSKIINILRQKGNEEFEIFLKILHESGNEVWARGLARSADQFQQEYANCANPEEDNRTPNGPANKASSEQLLLPPSDIMPLKSMPCELQVISSVKKDNKLYITAIGKAQDKDSKDDVPKDHVSRQIQVYSLDGKGNWSTLPEDPRQKPAPNYNAPVTVINGRIALVGGRDAETGKITNVLSTWDEEKHEWEQDSPPSMPTKRLTSGVCHRDNLLLVVGGVVDDKVKMLVNTVDVYDFSSNRWYTPKALDLPITQLRSPNVVVFKEYVYVIGGVTAYPAPPSEAQYNRHAWRALWSDVKEAVSKAGAAVIQGAHTRGAEGEPSKEVESVWKRIADPPVLRPTVVCYEDFLMAVGGVKDGTPQEGIYKFMDGKNADSCGSWRLVGNMSVGRYRHAVVPIGSRGAAALFVAGGYVLDNPEGDETIIKSSSVEMVIL